MYSRIPEEEQLVNKAKAIIVQYFNSQVDPALRVEETPGKFLIKEPVYLNSEMTFVVWFCKTLQNWKALVSTVLDDNRYYEVTYNGDKKETYIDVYEKRVNVVQKDPYIGV